MYAPIALFTYARVRHTRLTVESLLRNPESSEHDLIVFSDAARAKEDQRAVEDVRAYLASIGGFRSVTIQYLSENTGLAKSIINGVTQVLSEYERVIVLEDDIVTSQHFLAYMNESLHRFSDDYRVISIHGYVYPVNSSLPEAFFLQGADCWGWATWRRGWSLFNPNGAALLGELKSRNLLKKFDFNGAYYYSEMLAGQITGLNDSWAVRWYASAFLAGKLTLYPGRSLVNNIGNDSSGTHCGKGSSLDVRLSETPIDLRAIDIAPSAIAWSAFESFFKENQGTLLSRLFSKVKRIINKATA